MEIEPGPLKGLCIIRPKVFEDQRGWFFESFNQEAWENAGLEVKFVQDNHSRSAKGTIRGLHFQRAPGQAKLVRCTRGRVWDVAVDIRPTSPTLGQHFGLELTEENRIQVFIPVGFAHGFLVLEEGTEVQYKCSSVYNPRTESGIAWNDLELSIPWPVDQVGKPVVSSRDENNATFREYRQGWETPTR